MPKVKPCLRLSFTCAPLSFPQNSELPAPCPCLCTWLHTTEGRCCANVVQMLCRNQYSWNQRRALLSSIKPYRQWPSVSWGCHPLWPFSTALSHFLSVTQTPGNTVIVAEDTTKKAFQTKNSHVLNSEKQARDPEVIMSELQAITCDLILKAWCHQLYCK